MFTRSSAKKLNELSEMFKYLEKLVNETIVKKNEINSGR